jgi:lysophospholipase L1-like esterase
VPEEDSWVRRLEQYLRADFDSEFTVLNAGVPGYSSFQGKAYLERELVNLHPEVVVIVFGWNDHWAAACGIPDAQQVSPSPLLLDIQNAASRLRLYRLLRHCLIPAAAGADTLPFDQVPGPRRVAPEDFAQNLSAMVTFSRQHRILPVLMVPPVASEREYFGGVACNLHRLHYRYEAIIREVAEQTGAPLVDFQPEFDEWPGLFDDDPIHFNRWGHDLVAHRLAAEIGSSLNSADREP